MNYKIEEIFDQFVHEQEASLESVNQEIAYAKKNMTSPDGNYPEALGATTKLMFTATSQAAHACNKLPAMPIIRDLVLPSEKLNEACRYIIENQYLLADLYIELNKQKFLTGGSQVMVDPRNMTELLVPLSDNKRLMDELIPAASMLTDLVIDKLAIGAKENKTVCFVAGNPGAGKSHAMRNWTMNDAIGFDKNAIIYEAPMANNEWTQTAHKLLDKGFKVQYVQVYNDPETSYRNIINRSLESTKERFPIDPVKVNQFVTAYQALQDRPQFIESEFEGKVEFVGIDNRGNRLMPETLNVEEATKRFQYNIDTNFFKNLLSYANDKSKEAQDKSLSEYDGRNRAIQNQLAAVKQELSFACDVLSLQSKQLIADAGTAQKPVRGEVPAIYEGDRITVLAEESNLLDKVNFEENPYLKEEGEFTLVERGYDINRGMRFTGEASIKDSADVATIFKDLETSSVENAFAVYIPKGSDKAIVQHLASGGVNKTLVLPSFILYSANKVNAERVYFVHNHPSGQLNASGQDCSTWETVNNALKMFDIKLEDGIIINTKSGRYATFNPDRNITHEMKKELDNPKHYNVYEFSKLSFSKDYIPENLETLRCSSDVAQFISSHRLGDRDKIGYLVMNNSNKAIANFFLAETRIDDSNVNELAKTIVEGAIRFGGSTVVVYGRFEKQKGCSLSEKIKECSGGEILLLDLIKQEDKSMERYISYNDEGMLFEQKEDYGKQNNIGSVSSKEGTILIDIDPKALERVKPDYQGKVHLSAVSENGFIALHERIDGKNPIFEVTIDKRLAMEANGKLRMERDYTIKDIQSGKDVGARSMQSPKETQKTETVKKKRSKGLGL